MSGPYCRLALTPGEPAGIGPDLALRLVARESLPDNISVTLIADPVMLRRRAETLGLRIVLPVWDSGADFASGFSVFPLPMPQIVDPGRPDPANAEYLLRTLEIACDGCLDGRFDAMVTGPIAKNTINEAGMAFMGHTEFLAKRTRVPRAVMLLTADSLRVALATTHLPLREVPMAIDPDLLAAVLDILDRDMQRYFLSRRPRIAVTGLNPHAGEGGHLGREEIDVIAPAIAAARHLGLDVSGPWPADTVFLPERLAACDVVLTMYHDQGLPVLKNRGFSRAVNVTLGLPIIRTSVDHGVALDLAATGKGDQGSLRSALFLAVAMVGRRRNFSVSVGRY